MTSVSPLHLDLPHAPESVGHARRESSDFLLGSVAGVDLGDLVDDLRLVVSELVTNAVRHGEPPVHLSIDLDLRDGDGVRRVTVVCRDGGPWDGSEPSPHGGRGLTLVEALAELHIQGGATSTVVTAHLTR